jgi:hypothetical protein
MKIITKFIRYMHYKIAYKSVSLESVLLDKLLSYF